VGDQPAQVRDAGRRRPRPQVAHPRGYGTRLGSDSELDAALRPLRDGNDLVFDIASSYLNLLDVFFIGFATWHRGDTLDASDFESVYDQDERQQIAATGEGDPTCPQTHPAAHDLYRERGLISRARGNNRADGGRPVR
jgi:hypothetical protein